MNFKIPFDLKKNKKQVMIFVVLIFLISIFIYFKCCFGPQIARVSGLLSKVGKTNQDLKSAMSDISMIEKYKSNIEAYKAKVERYEKTLPAEQEIPSLLETLSRMAKSSNIKISALTPVSGSGKGGETTHTYREIPILISAKSGYHELGQFLSAMENSDRFMKVVDIDIRANNTTPRKHDVELLICTYILLNEGG